jgi:hypothetical protein
MLTKLFSDKDLDAFAKSLAESLAKRYPPSLETAAGRKVSVNRVTRVMEDILERVADYNKTRKLGMFKKARLGNSFRWELKELGYSEKFIEVATEGVIVYLTRKQGEAEKPTGPAGG